jgi:hypothetical protein
MRERMDWDFTWLIELTLVVIVFFVFGYFLGVNW